MDPAAQAVVNEELQQDGLGVRMALEIPEHRQLRIDFAVL